MLSLKNLQVKTLLPKNSLIYKNHQAKFIKFPLKKKGSPVICDKLKLMQGGLNIIFMASKKRKVYQEMLALNPAHL
jgi:hypothetical protein